MTFHEKLNTLKRAISIECEARMCRDSRLDCTELADWLICHKRPEVIDGLTVLIGQAMDRINNDEKVKRIVRSLPELEGLLPQMCRCADDLAMELAMVERSDRRNEELEWQYDTILTMQKGLRSVIDELPDMTLDQAWREMWRSHTDPLNPSPCVTAKRLHPEDLEDDLFLF